MLTVKTNKSRNVFQLVRVPVICAAFVFLALLVSAASVQAQTTEFTYQGSLNVGGLAANGGFDFEFALFDVAVGGSQLGATQTRTNVSVANGVFSVELDFGNQFPGADRFLEIRVRQSGGAAFTTLDPRQRVNSSPYSVKSLEAENASNADIATNAMQLGGVAANQYVITTDPRMTDERTPTAGSSNYIQNQNAGAQAASNFNISGDGTAGGTLSGNIVNSATQYNIGGNRVLSVAGTENVFAGVGAGSNTTGSFNSFFGRAAGFNNTTGSQNSFFGRAAGAFNTTGNNNSFFGLQAGFNNTSGGSNSFFGLDAGIGNTTGNNNAFFGLNAGLANTTGSSNTMIGSGSNVGIGNLTRATAIGAGSVVSTSNTIALGRPGGEDQVVIPGSLNVSGTHTANIVSAVTHYNIGGSRVFSVGGTQNVFAGVSAGTNTTGSSNSFFGNTVGFNNTTGSNNSFFGFNAGAFNGTGSSNSFFGRSAGFNNTTGDFNSFFGRSAGSSNTTGANNTVIGNNADVGGGNLSFATAIGASAVVTASNTVVLGRTTDTVSAPGSLIVGNSLVKRGDVNLYSNAGNMDLYMQAAGATTGVNFGVSSDPTMFIAHYDGITYQNRIILTPTGTVRILTLGDAGANALCRNASQELATCSSSLRYKSNIGQFSQGISFVNRLHPISFDWKDGGMKDVGFGAEDIAKIDPRFVTYNEKGEVEGVKYDRLGVVLVNAVKEQQEEISGLRSVVSGQQHQIKAKQKQITALIQYICATDPKAALCTEEK